MSVPKLCVVAPERGHSVFRHQVFPVRIDERTGNAYDAVTTRHRVRSRTPRLEKAGSTNCRFFYFTAAAT
jgi:hypothetical protein